MSKTQSGLQDAMTLLKLLAHPIRLQIVCDLVSGEKSVSDLYQEAVISQSAFSQHLALLKEHKVVTSRKEGLCVFYKIKEAAAKSIIKVLHQHFCK